MSNKVRVAIIGIGNCANALIQGVTYYQNAAPDEDIPGLMHATVGGYHVSDIEFTAAFDVNENKVGQDLSQAIWAAPNDTIKFAEVDPTGIVVQRGPTMDGIGYYVNQVITESDAVPVDVVQILRDTKTDVLVNYLPVGSEEAAKWYALQAIEAGCAFVNGIPVFIATDPIWRAKFEAAQLPIIGDDIKSQVGATITHRVLANLFNDRGVKLDRTYQLNFGGNMDFYNMLERSRLESKKISKTNAVTSQLPYDLGDENVHVGPSDYVPWLTDRKWCHIKMEGRAFGDVPLEIDLKLEVWDSPNSAGVIIDAVRCAKIALDRGIGGAVIAPSSYFMKSPPSQFPDDVARNHMETFISTGEDAAFDAT